MKPLSAGSEIDAWCTKCRMDLGHRIVAMVDDRPKRVVCLTCDSQHNYRPPQAKAQAKAKDAAVRPSRAPKARSDSPTQRARAEQDRVRGWELKVLGKAVDELTRYDIARSYVAGELVLHQKFGEGYVAEVMQDGKVSVMFRDGSRVLAHGRG